MKTIKIFTGCTCAIFGLMLAGAECQGDMTTQIVGNVAGLLLFATPVILFARTEAKNGSR